MADVYMQSRYEFNIKDSWGQGKGAPCGTFGNLVNSKEPEFIMHYLQWYGKRWIFNIKQHVLMSKVKR